ncbi:metal-dependent hydrolase [Halalkalicoccus salilacus]|uniref:metal-dependent hydrolase n=1 Tax=Halalkalicoccus salilacus TaxID=3117459 RepID=UPI00300F27DA
MAVERVLFLTIAVLTHGIVGYALVRAFTDVNPTVGFLLGILPDVDFLFPAAWGAPFIHRGITHTALFLIAIVTVASLWRSRKRLELASGLAVGSHLAIDSWSPMGVSWLFPLGIGVSGDLPVHGPTGTLVLWTLSIGLLVWRGQRPLSTVADSR